MKEELGKDAELRLSVRRPLRRLLVAKGAHGPIIDEIFDLT